MIYRKLHGYKYELLLTVAIDTKIKGLEIDTKYIKLWNDGRLFVKERYAWDGASGPTWDDKTNMRGSLIHDALYQLMREGMLGRKWRKYADELLRDICIQDGMNKWRAGLWYWAVRTFGEKTSKPEASPRGKIVELDLKLLRIK